MMGLRASVELIWPARMHDNKSMSPPQPEPARFDSALGAWVLSRYADVLAAVQEPRLWPAGLTEERDESGKLNARGEIQEAFSFLNVRTWQETMEASARHAVDHLPAGVPVDLVSQYAQPWCLEVAILATRADAGDRDRLSQLSAQAFAATGEPDDSPLQSEATAASAELQRILGKGGVPMAEPAFVGTAQTLPRLLASGWLALLEHPAEWARLHAHPELMPGAIEELQRYAGPVRSVVRRARSSLDLGGVRIPAGDRVLLMLAAANRDPAQFPDPDRLDVTRRATGQVALGMGRNSCAGGTLIRISAAVATDALVAKFRVAELGGAVEWRSGSRFAWPAVLPATLRGRCSSGSVMAQNL